MFNFELGIFKDSLENHLCLELPISFHVTKFVLKIRVNYSMVRWKNFID